MTELNKKYWAFIDRFEYRRNNTIASAICLPIILFLIGYRLYLEPSKLASRFGLDISFATLTEAIKFSLIGCGVLFIILILYNLIPFIYQSSFVIFKENSFVFYKYFWSKEGKEYFYSEIKECCAARGPWIRRGIKYTEQHIVLFNDDERLLTLGRNPYIFYEFYKKLGSKKFFITGKQNFYKLCSVSRGYEIDFDSLTEEEQFAIAKAQCAIVFQAWSGEQVLKKYYKKKNRRKKKIK